MKSIKFLPFFLPFFFINLKSQTDSLVKELLKESERWKNLKITGWIQPQLQFTDSSGAKNFDGGDFFPIQTNVLSFDAAE